MERPQFLEIEHHDCQNRSKLDHHIKHLHKSITLLQLYKLIHQNQMSGTADRQPFGNPLYNSKKDYF